MTSGNADIADASSPRVGHDDDQPGTDTNERSEQEQNTDQPRSLSDILDRIEQSAKDEPEISVDDLVDHVGESSFVPLLLVGGIIMGAPVIGVIPGIPTFSGVCVALVAVQIIFGRRRLWLPKWIRRRTIPSDKLTGAVGWLRRPTAWLDRMTRPRLSWLAEGPMRRVYAAACLLIAVSGPAMELVPFSANLAGLAVVAFGLSLLVGDGLIGLFALSFCGLFTSMLGWHLMSG